MADIYSSYLLDFSDKELAQEKIENYDANQTLQCPLRFHLVDSTCLGNKCRWYKLSKIRGSCKPDTYFIALGRCSIEDIGKSNE
jgi:hypothetical protein